MSASSDPAPTRPPRRFGLGTRLALIVVAGLLAVQVLMLAAYVLERQRSASPVAVLMVMQRIAALAQLLDRLPSAERDLAVRAATGPGFLAAIQAEKPDIETPRLLGFAERRLRMLTGLPPDRFVALSLAGDDHPHGLVERLRDLRGAKLTVAFALADGGYLEIVAGGDVTVRVLGLPVGLVAGILGFLVALAALLAVRRETRPLSDLAAAVEGFGAQLKPSHVTERGAPDVRLVVRAVNAMQDRIVELVRMRTLVLGAISHDLRTYLTRLRLRLELMPPGDQVEKARADLDGMQALVDDALAFARASFSPASGETVDLAALARAECEARRAQGAAVTLHGADAERVVAGNRGALARVLANLAGNAIAYGGRADISLHDRGDAVDLVVEDRGPGIPAGERETVFEPFYRLEPSRNRDSGGAGLGLTIVRQIAEGHRGSVTISDRPGGGARLSVRLPKPGVKEGTP
jgi:two-component system, OmpR family, osmolarity sensor histidine kinase EnvZ